MGFRSSLTKGVVLPIMGCDIHAVIEIDTGYGFADYHGEAFEFPVGRNYTLFALLANVRNYGSMSFIAEPRGIPTDISRETEELFASWEADGHSHSWVTFQELETYITNIVDSTNKEENFCRIRDANFYLIMEVLAQKYGGEKVRLVFCFDN